MTDRQGVTPDMHQNAYPLVKEMSGVILLVDGEIEYFPIVSYGCFWKKAIFSSTNKGKGIIIRYSRCFWSTGNGVQLTACSYWWYMIWGQWKMGAEEVGSVRAASTIIDFWGNCIGSGRSLQLIGRMTHWDGQKSITTAVPFVVAEHWVAQSGVYGGGGRCGLRSKIGEVNLGT